MIEAEKGVISCMLKDGAISLNTKLLPQHFNNAQLRRCFEVIMEYPGKEVEVTALAEKAEIDKELAMDIELFTATSGGYQQYEDVVVENYFYRQYAKLSKKINTAAEQKTGVEQIKQLISKISDVGVETIEVDTLVAGSIDTALSIADGKENPTICGFGYTDLDTYLKGYRRGSLITIGARTGVGKSTFALNMINQALRQGIECVLFSTEMPAKEIHTRFLSMRTGLTQHQMENPTDDITEKLTEAIGKFETGVECSIYDRFGDFQNMCNLIRKEALEGKKLFFVDYLQNITNRSQFNLKTHIIGEMSMGLKKLAIELGVCVIQCAQLNRASTKEANKQPIISNLRESGDIEQDSDVILLLHDPNKYDEYHPSNRLDVIIGKNRHGREVTLEIGIKRKNFTIYDI